MTAAIFKKLFSAQEISICFSTKLYVSLFKKTRVVQTFWIVLSVTHSINFFQRGKKKNPAFYSQNKSATVKALNRLGPNGLVCLDLSRLQTLVYEEQIGPRGFVPRT